MQIAHEAEQNFTVSEAAAIVGRSTSWVRDRRMFGPLIPTEKNGLQAVDAASLFALLSRLRPKRSMQRPYLRLVVDNTRPA